MKTAMKIIARYGLGVGSKDSLAAEREKLATWQLITVGVAATVCFVCLLIAIAKLAIAIN